MCSRILPALLALAALLVGACSLNEVVSPYRIDVRQGNFVTPEMVSRLKLGMRPEQVRFVLGTPLIEDPFHADRWDYVYLFKPGRGEATQRRLAVYFRGGTLAEIKGDIPAASGGEVAPATRVIEIAAPASNK